MRWVVIALLALAALVVAVLVVGWSLPVKHRASRSMRIGARPAAVFALISNAGDYPRWRTGVSRIELLAGDPTAPSRFREHSSDGAITYEVAERVPDRRIVTRIADEGLPFGGRWTYELEPDGEGTRLSITEDGEVYNPLVRFVSRFVMGHTASIDRYLNDVARAISR